LHLQLPQHAVRSVTPWMSTRNAARKTAPHWVILPKLLSMCHCGKTDEFMIQHAAALDDIN